MNFLLNIKNFLLDAGDVAAEVDKILGEWIGPLFIALGGVAAVYVIILAIQYIRSESDSKRVEAKTRMVNCIIGFLSLLVIGSLCTFVDWAGVANLFGYAGK